MKRLSIVAIVFAIVAAFTTHVNSKPLLQSAWGFNNDERPSCVEGNIIGSDCGTGMDVQCKVSIPGVSPNPVAWQDETSCLIPFTRPAN